MSFVILSMQCVIYDQFKKFTVRKKCFVRIDVDGVDTVDP